MVIIDCNLACQVSLALQMPHKQKTLPVMRVLCLVRMSWCGTTMHMFCSSYARLFACLHDSTFIAMRPWDICSRVPVPFISATDRRQHHHILYLLSVLCPSPFAYWSCHASSPHLCVNLREGIRPLDPLDDSNSLSDLARSMHHMQPSPAQSASADSSSMQPAANGPLVQLMHSIAKATGSAECAATAEGGATDLGVEVGNRIVQADEAVNHAAGVSLAQPQDFEEEEALGGPISTDEGASVRHLKGEILLQRRAHGQIPAAHAQGHSAAEEQASEVGGGRSRHDDVDRDIPVCSAQDFFKRQG